MADPLTEVLESYRDYLQKLQNLSQDKIQEACKEFFAKNPAILAFSWTQWVPGFNDGDPCRFTLGEPCVLWKRECFEQDPEAKDWRTKELKVMELWEKDPTEEEILGFGESELGREDAEYSPPWGGRLKPEFQAQDDAFSELWRKLSRVEDVLEKVFGSDVHVIVTPNNIVVNSYDCGY